GNSVIIRHRLRQTNNRSARQNQKFSKGHVKSKSDFVQSFDSGILGETPNDIIQSRLLNIAHGGKFINCDMAFLAQLSYSLLCKNSNQVPR
ncbi:MAG: hypothetical protein PUC27_06815, partial [Clostridium sp.]|nr:hypothetical protein [Clostridium sp.]